MEGEQPYLGDLLTIEMNPLTNWDDPPSSSRLTPAKVTWPLQQQWILRPKISRLDLESSWNQFPVGRFMGYFLPLQEMGRFGVSWAFTWNRCAWKMFLARWWLDSSSSFRFWNIYTKWILKKNNWTPLHPWWDVTINHGWTEQFFSGCIYKTSLSNGFGTKTTSARYVSIYSLNHPQPLQTFIFCSLSPQKKTP